MTKITQEELNAALKLHELWLSGKEGGAQLRLNEHDLSGLSLRGANLENASFAWSILRDTDFRDAKLSNTDFRGADIFGAKLQWADLFGTKKNNRETQK